MGQLMRLYYEIPLCFCQAHANEEFRITWLPALFVKLPFASIQFCREQFAPSNVRKHVLDQTVLKSVSATTVVNVIPKLDSASVLKVSPGSGLFSSFVCFQAVFDIRLRDHENIGFFLNWCETSVGNSSLRKVTIGCTLRLIITKWFFIFFIF